MINFEIDIVIDDQALDVEWLNQPQLALKYGEHWAKCYRELQKAEEQVKIVKADLNKLANERPDKYLGVDVKPTVANVDAFIRNHPSHIKAKEEWIQATYECNMAEIAKREISYSRKDALENLVKLHGQNYFTGPSVPRDLSYENTQRQAQIRSNASVQSKLKRTKLRNNE